MTRSPLFYPMHRVDSDAGGAADLQTDIMRFMAILALCLVAIFALVQSIPLIPEAPAQVPVTAAPPTPPAESSESVPPQPETTSPAEPSKTTAQAVNLTRPKRTSSFAPRARMLSPPVQPLPRPKAIQAPEVASESPVPRPAKPEKTSDRSSNGFTLRFESDLALTRLVAAGKVGLYAIGGGRAQRMTVSESRISFWDASTPNAFHEMESRTVPRVVVDALARSGASVATVSWGVTLPGGLREQLDELMRGNSGGELVIGADGNLRLEAS